MHTIIGTFFIILLTCFPAWGEDNLVGRWDTLDRSKGGIGSIFHFNADGTVEITVGAMLDYSYVIEGRQITVVMNDHSYTLPGIRIEEGELVTDDQDRPKEAFPLKVVRLGGDSYALKGRISRPWDEGVTQIEEYLENGRLLYRIPFRTDKGTYQISGNRLSITLDAGRRLLRFGYRLEENILFLLPDGSDAEDRYQKIDAPPVHAEAPQATP